jgi:progressive ankylosis protein
MSRTRSQEAHELTGRQILLFWLPLFASWLLMTSEGPFVSAVINRLPDEVIMLAAQGIVVSLSVLIESPIMNLLATSTALVRDRPSFLLVRKFTIHWAIFLTAVTALLAFTPVFDLVVVRLLQTPEPIARWVKPGLQIMLLWSAAIAWRRFLQGVMIHFGRTNRVAWGTAVRLASSGGTAAVLGLGSGLPGVIIGASALMAGVIAEAIYATIAVRPILAHQLSAANATTENTAMLYSELFWFHLPLASTSVLNLLAQPLVQSSLARLANPTLSLAAWPVVFQITLMSRAAAFAWPEVVIALSRNRQSFLPIRRFTIEMAAALTTLMALFVFTPLSAFYIFVVQDMAEIVGTLARNSLALFVLWPAITVFISWLRGLLIRKRVTSQVNAGMAMNLIVTAVLLAVGVMMQLPGLETAAIALNAAALCEVIYLGWRTRRILAPDIRLFSRQQPGSP